MGSAQSSNVASAIADVSNFVSNSTVANVAQAQSIQNSTEFINCDVKLSGDLNVSDISNVIQQSTQIVSAKNDANVANNIQQQMLQQAQSTVGFMGIGFADANNSASEMVNATSNISNAMTTSASQFEQISSDFICDNSTIIANNLNIGFNNTGSMIANQTLNNDQVADITNNISQTITQKATATVQGISALLILIVIIIAIIVWGVTRTLSSGGVRVAVTIILLVLTAGIVSFMYIKSTPPFFAEPSKCLKDCPIGTGNSDCINYSSQDYNISSAPLRYSIALLPANQTAGGGNLLQMAISKASGQSNESVSNNGGYNMETKLTLDNLINNYMSLAQRIGISTPLPNPLYDASTLLSSATGYLAIPSAYLAIAEQSSGDTTTSSCTPGTIQAQIGAPVTNGCPRVIDPSNLAVIPKTSDNASLAIANLNDKAFVSYIIGQNPDSGNNTQLLRSLFVRFMLCDILGIQGLNIYVNGSEPITFISASGPTYGLPNDAPDNCYLFTPNGIPDPLWANAVSYGGHLRGEVGVVNDTTYKFSNFMSNIGKYFIIILLVIAVICIFWSKIFGYNKDSSSNQPVKESSSSSSSSSSPKKQIN